MTIPRRCLADSKKRDDDLRSPRFFDVKTYPTIAFRGAGGQPVSTNRWAVEALAIIRGITQPTPLEVNLRGVTHDENGRVKVALSVATHLRRSDFGLITDLREQSGELGTEPDIDVYVDVEAFLQA